MVSLDKEPLPEPEKPGRFRQTLDGAANLTPGCDSDCSMPDCGECMPDCGGDCGSFLVSMTLFGGLALATPNRPPRTGRSGVGRSGVGRLRVGMGTRAGMGAIRGYQRWLSPRLRTRCRHTPSCSAYGYAAVGRYGLVTGSRLTAARIGRCKPGTPRGTHDPVP